MNIPTDFLTPKDFEDFSNRLVEILFGKNIIGFGDGKDDGIDGIDNIANPTIVIQSKRYQSRSSPANFVKLAKKEIDKIKLTAKKFNWKTSFEYIIVTSADLNPNSRNLIRKYAGNMMSSDENIIDGPFLKKLSDENRFHTLFVNFGLKDKKITDILKNINYDYISSESTDYFADFNLKYFVETKILHELYEIMDKEHLAILTGNPGVGKTTTCKMLGNLFSCKGDGEYLILERSIDEVQNIIQTFNQYYRKENSKKIFIVFDDFLGRTSLDTNEKQIKKLRALYSLVNNSENLYVLLNSRTQILSTAKKEDIEFGKLIDDRNTKIISINISDYSSIEKARIFRSCIEFEFDNQSKADKKLMNKKYDDLLENKKYRQIVYHRNFNPRLIKLIASQATKIKGNYFKYCLKSLNNPTDIYNGLFKKLPDTHKFFLICLYCFDYYPVNLKVMEKTFKETVIEDNFDLNDIEKELEESWITIKNDETLLNEQIDFVNPSIIDFISNKKDTNSLFSRVESKSKLLCQIVKSSNVSNLYDKIKNNYVWYNDKDSFTGEKISIILEQEYIQNKTDFIDLLYKFNGKYYSKISDSILNLKGDWTDLIREFYFSKNMTAKSLFLKELLFSKNNNQLISNMTNNNIDIDELAEYLDLIIEEIYNTNLQQNELIDYAEEVSGLNLYNELLYTKIQYVQESLDNFYDIEDFLDFDNLFESEEDKILAIDLILGRFKDYIWDTLKYSFFKNDIEDSDLDYSNAEEYIKQEAEEYLLMSNDTENYESAYASNTESIDSILGKSLV
ncbi:MULTISPECIES: AAA family ATPase [Enterococcus]|uniref:nSTAND3 domain-containing NTPase n=1 Tax=Enterococcus TaxID=1350 RepID=UPI0001F0B41B|nr:AAA family ATPase [Enterococcus faecalis]EFT90274.1 hypothetical protein HMPREF9497_02855 [Enterococcus faecalis TX4244]HAP3565803.1 ATP-binding protein [Enterococcus faecalis]